MAARVRFAPSPTGDLHLGGLRTALFNHLLARCTGGTFLLRVEDTDDARRVEGSVEGIISVLDWCGIASDEAVRVQSEHLTSYTDAAQELVERGEAYPCFCSADELAARRRADPHFMYDGHCASVPGEEAAERVAAGEAHTVRMNVSAALERLVEDGAGECCVSHSGPSTARRPALAVVFDDALRGRIEIPATAIDDQVLLKANGWPTYHLANTLDDRVQGISHVLRGTEWLSSTPKHVLLHHALHRAELEAAAAGAAEGKAQRAKCPQWVHLPLLVNAADRSKLSKRQGGAAVDNLRTAGYLPSAVVNFVALLGWSGVDDTSASSLAHLETLFDASKLNVAEAAVDFDRLKWVNQQHIAALCGKGPAADAAPAADRAALHAHALRFLPQSANDATTTAEYVSDALALLGNRIATLAELDAPPGDGHAAPFFRSPDLAHPSTAKMGATAWHCAKGAAAGAPEAGAESAALAGAISAALRARPQSANSFAESADVRADAMDRVLRAVGEAHGVQPGRIMQLARYATTGMKGGPALGATLALLGRDEVVARLDAAIAFHAA